MYYTLLILQCLGILFMFYELIHISRQRPSKFQTLLLLLVGAILINTYGYTLEITATGKELALQAVHISYLAKPFILYLMYIFVMKYCGFSIPKAGKCILFSLAAFISVLVFTSDYNTLFYSHISFSYSGLFPHLILHMVLSTNYIQPFLASILSACFLPVHAFLFSINRALSANRYFF